MSDSYKISCTPPALAAIASNTLNNLIPGKSREMLERAYNKFTTWAREHQAVNFTENVVLAYFAHLSKSLKSSTMWAQYSMLKAELNIKDSINILSYKKVQAFLKQKSENYATKKSKTFTKNQVDTFLTEAPDKKYLAMKPCRIPTFGTRIPQVGAKPTVVKQLPSPEPQITNHHVGRTVQVGYKRGTLKYIGPVHFAEGQWCGVELSDASGKNNGTIKGVEYFPCPELRGLMAPVCKVSLVDDGSEDDTSGPYSILCLDSRRPSGGQLLTVVSKRPLRPNEISLSAENISQSLEVKRRKKSEFASVLLDRECSARIPDFNKPNWQSLHLNGKKSTDSSSDPLFGGCKDDLKKFFRPEKPNSLPQLLVAYGDNRSNFPEVDNDSDGTNKRDSLDCDESLGILTPDQMVDITSLLDCDKLLGILTPDKFYPSSDENSAPVKKFSHPNLDKQETSNEEVQSPNITSATTDQSLGIIDPDQMLTGFSFIDTKTTMNFELPLDPVQSRLTRCDETPSPEELPLDTTPIVESEPTKTETVKSKTSNSFITSITSITSLDTGYQGDGEMSRPASRGADNSPLTRRPFSRPLPRRPDPMTDSDFYTESDADNHEENHLKGDRRAQVIDGTLYGVDPQAAADIYANNRENMDSSGVFTDIESGLRNEDEHDNGNELQMEHNNNRTTDVSPSESTKTVSPNSQLNLKEMSEREMDDLDERTSVKTVNEYPKKRNADSPSSTSQSSPRRSKEESTTKKFKMPKRDVVSKVKTRLEETTPVSTEKKQLKKPVNKWDAVMNKISKNEQNRTNLKEVKAKVFDNVNLGPTHKSNLPQSPSGLNSPNNNNVNNKSRRARTRAPLVSNSLKAALRSNLQNSNYSSLSDLSAASLPKKNLTSSTKKKEAIQVTQVLIPNKLKTQKTANENKKNAPPSLLLPQNNAKSKMQGSSLVPSKEKRLQNHTILKESNKPAVKGGRTPPTVRTPAQVTTRAPAKKAPIAPRTAEALAVLVQHLVFNVEAFQVPHLRHQVEKYRLAAEEVRLECKNLTEALGNVQITHATNLEEERLKYQKDIEELIETQRNQILQLTSQHSEVQRQLQLEKETVEQHLKQKHEEQLGRLRLELEKVQKSHEEALDILREENDCIREQIDEHRLALEQTHRENQKLRNDYQARETQMKHEVDTLKLQKDKLKQQIAKIESDFQDKLKSLIDENSRLREQNDRLLSYGDNKDVAKQEVQSLRVVLELKQNEVTELRKSLEEAKEKQQQLEGVEEKAAALKARCEDLQHQLQRKCEYEQTLIQENQRLEESFKEQVNHSKRLTQNNEELQWKLLQSKEVINKVIEQAADETAFNRHVAYSSSFNENHQHSMRSLERMFSYSKTGTKAGEGGELSPPSSPKVKGVVEKSDSVSYVLDLDESPDLVASRILRRSFRNSSAIKITPTNSPSNKRPRIRNTLSTSASSSSLLNRDKDEDCDEELRPSSASAGNGDCAEDDVFLWENRKSSTPKYHDDGHLDLDEEHEEDLRLPALPSEMDKRNGILTLPTPKRLAADSAGSESNSEDESTSSSQL